MFINGKALPKSYNELVNEALDEVNRGQHLRFIKDLYKTKEVCLAAVKYESNGSVMLHDIYSVPMGNLDYVMEQMREFKKNDAYYLEDLEKAYITKKEYEKTPGYYGEFKNYDDLLAHYEVNNYDDMSIKKFNLMRKTTSI